MRCTQLRAAHFDRQKLAQTNGQIERQTYRNTDRHIILAGPHRGPPDPSVGINYYCIDYTAEPVACGRMRCTQLRDLRIIFKTRTTGRRDRHIDRHISSTGPHWKLILIPKSQKFPRTTGRTDRHTDGRTCYTAMQGV